MKRIAKKMTVALVAGLTALSLSATANATLIAYDGFEGYTIGTLDGQKPGTTGFPASNAWTAEDALSASVYPRVAAAGLSYSTLPTSGGSAEWYRSNSTTTNYVKRIRRAASTTDTSSVQWASFLVQQPATPSDEMVVTLGWVSGNALSVAFSKTGLATYRYSNTTGSVLPTFSGTSNSLAVTHMVVLKIESVTDAGQEQRDQITMWVDPNLAALQPGNEATLGIGYTGRALLRDDVNGIPQAFSLLRFAATPNNDSTSLDEFRLGTTLYDVVPIPEPVGILAATMAAGLLMTRRRGIRR